MFLNRPQWRKSMNQRERLVAASLEEIYRGPYNTYLALLKKWQVSKSINFKIFPLFFIYKKDMKQMFF